MVSSIVVVDDLDGEVVGGEVLLGHSQLGDQNVVALPIDKMNMQIDRGQAPKGIFRVDRGRDATHELPHAAFGKGKVAPSLNIDGTWKHGYVDVTRKQRDWLAGYGWKFD